METINRTAAHSRRMSFTKKRNLEKIKRRPEWERKLGKTCLIFLCVGILTSFSGILPASAQHEVKTVDGLKVMLGVISVQEIKEHPEKHHAIEMKEKGKRTENG